MIKFFNTLSGKFDEFAPLNPSEVSLYTCGPTVYDYAHIGNFRTFVFEDLLRRFLEFQGFKVKHVMNITDVDDKTIAGSQREGKKLADFTAAFSEAFQEDLKTLNILPATIQPRAAEEIPAMLRLIEELIKKGTAYASDGSVYYRVSSFAPYGKLSKKNLEKNIQGARVDVDEYEKEEGADFVLWKKAKEGEPSWDSPWGQGRPGWHIECSAMSMKYLGETFDIHAGGEDLIFPHHENEIAQSEAATGKPFVRYWLHSKHLLVNGEKMSKSKGNFFTLRDLLAKGCDPMAIRYALLSTHYRTPLNFTLEGLKEAEEVIKRLDDCYWMCVNQAGLNQGEKTRQTLGNFEDLSKVLSDYLDKMKTTLGNDLNISVALRWLLKDAVNEINYGISQFLMQPSFFVASLDFFKKADRLFGLDIASVTEIPKEVSKKLLERSELRKNKDFEKANQNRNELNQMGWLVKDGRPGEPSTVKKKRRAWDK